MPTRVLPRQIPGPKPPPITLPEPPVRPGYVIGSFGDASIDQWDAAFIAGADAVWKTRKVRVNPRFVKAMMHVETDERKGNYPPDACRPCDGEDCVPACGPMQIKWPYHQKRCPECNRKTVPGQIEMAFHILGMTMQERDLDEFGAFLAVYFPADDINGTTQQGYVKTLKRLIRQMEANAEGTTLADEPDDEQEPPAPPLDIISIIVGGRPTNTDYGFKAPAAGPYYEYFEEHGGSRNQHTGIDPSGVKGQTLYSPIRGKVVCAGTGKGPGAWGTGCAAFADVMGNGAGRIEILTEDEKHSLILGHCSDALVDAGDQVEIEDPVARMGGMNGWHVHVERRRFVGGQHIYVIEDPLLFNRPGATAPGKAPELPPFTWLESPNRMSRQGRKPLALVYHMTDDLNLDNVLGWLRQPGSNASAHWVVAEDGRAFQLVGSAYAAFTNGAVLNPNPDIPWLRERAHLFESGRENANWYTITFELVNVRGRPFKDAQIATVVQLAKYYLGVYPTISNTRGGHTRHSDYASAQRGPKPDPTGRIDRTYCPGELFPLREVILACGGNPDRMAA